MIDVIAESEDKKYAKISLKGLNPLMSKTISTALERTILSSIEACSPVFISLNNFTNYFDNDVFKEKFIQIRSNIENIKLISNKNIVLNYSGKVFGELKVKDLKVTSFSLGNNTVEFLNPEDTILTVGIAEGYDINLNIHVFKGVYFSTTEDNVFFVKKHKGGMIDDTDIICNSNYNPIDKVKTKIFSGDGVDELIIDIHTDGRVTAISAFKLAWNKLYSIFDSYRQSIDLLTDNFIETFDEVEKDENVIKTLEELPLNSNEYNFVKINYRYLKDFLEDFGSENMKSMFTTNNIPFDENELRQRLESMGIKVRKRLN